MIRRGVINATMHYITMDRIAYAVRDDFILAFRRHLDACDERFYANRKCTENLLLWISTFARGADDFTYFTYLSMLESRVTWSEKSIKWVGNADKNFPQRNRIRSRSVSKPRMDKSVTTGPFPYGFCRFLKKVISGTRDFWF